MAGLVTTALIRPCHARVSGGAFRAAALCRMGAAHDLGEIAGVNPFHFIKDLQRQFSRRSSGPSACQTITYFIV